MLRAVALALMGSDGFTDLIFRPGDWVEFGQQQCRIRVEFELEREHRAVELVLDRRDNVRDALERNQQALGSIDRLIDERPRDIFVVGYGASRRLARPGRSPVMPFKYPRSQAVATLFMPDAQLYPIQDWALELRRRKRDGSLAQIKRVFDELLPHVSFVDIGADGELIFMTSDGKVRLEDLSEGYQNIIAWVGDLLYRMTASRPRAMDVRTFEGIVLLDEIDLHLHPRWQRHLRGFIERVFPRLQVVGTTHAPLMAQQSHAHEVVVLKRSGAQVNAEVFDQAPWRLAAPQVMLSPLFAVESLESTEVTERKARRRELLARETLSAAEAEELRRIEGELRALPDWGPVTANELASLEELVQERRRLAKLLLGEDG